MTLTTEEAPLLAALVDAHSLAPAGVTFRRWRDRTDFDRMVDVFHAARVVDGAGWELTPELIEADIRGLGHRPEDTIVLAEAGGGVVGFVRVFDFGRAPDEGRQLMHSGHVDPAWRGRGIGTALLAAAQSELLRIRAARPDPAGTTAGFHAWVFDRNVSTHRFVESHGYRSLRFVIEMARTLDDLPEIALPEGLTTRPVTEADRMPVVRALDAAMHDHRGWPAMSDKMLVDFTNHPMRGQLDVWQVAWAGDRVVGGVLGFIDESENEARGRLRGWTESIFTVRDWRNRGVASAMLARSLRYMRDRGMTEAALTVDTDSLTGAVGLYERHGFREAERLTVFRRDLDPAP
jgi:GNAT superfamily N-acetyltransferase